MTKPDHGTVPTTLGLQSSHPHVLPAGHQIEKLTGPASFDADVFPEGIVSLERTAWPG